MPSWLASTKKCWRKPGLALLLLLAPFLFCACADLTPLPPLRGLSAEQKAKEIDARRMEVGWLSVHSGGSFVPYATQFELPDYFKASRCPEAESRARGWDSQQKWVMTSFLAGALFVAGSQFKNSDKESFGIPGIGLLALSIDLDFWSRSDYLKPAAYEFNRCMEQQAMDGAAR